MRFAGGLVRHLGLQMYSGAVPAIAELISNAWDAMAQEVRVNMPFGRPLEPDDEIVVSDDGVGMSFDECRDKYLVLGRDRRRDEGDFAQPYQGRPRRLLTARKGIGKLAGFGIANRIEIRTVKNGEVTHFALDYDKITRGKQFVEQYQAELLEDDSKKVDEPNGTRVALTGMKIRRTISEDSFRASMSRRFTILGDPNFRVYVNDEQLTREEQPFQFRFPPEPGGWNSEDVPGAGIIKWWCGFRKETIADEEARGIVVFARGKLAQNPWFFGISGGVYGQHGMQYMTGEVVADFLDVTDGADMIATDRGSALWEEATPAALKTWGEKKVKELLQEWAKLRTQEKVRRPGVSRYLDLAERLPGKDRDLFQQFVNRIVSIPQIDKDEEIVDELVKFGYNALSNYRFLELVRQLNAASPADLDRVVEILSEWDVMEAVMTAQKVKGRVEIIRKFGEMIQAGVPEKPDMHEFLKKHPWLIDPQWEALEHERSLDKLLADQFHAEKIGDQESRRRVDFFCLATARQWEVVELKRPEETVGREELRQVQDYVFFLRSHAKGTTDPRVGVDRIGGILVHSNLATGTEELVDSLFRDGIYVRTWARLLQTTESLHREFLEVVKRRAPADDPRMRALEDSDDEPGSENRSEQEEEQD
jgi:hypothetical protein